MSIFNTSGAADARTKAQESSGLLRFKLAQGLGALAIALSPGRFAVLGAIVVQWEKVLAGMPQVPAFLTDFKPKARPAKVVKVAARAPAAQPTCTVSLDAVLAMAKTTCGAMAIRGGRRC